MHDCRQPYTCKAGFSARPDPLQGWRLGAGMASSLVLEEILPDGQRHAFLRGPLYAGVKLTGEILSRTFHGLVPGTSYFAGVTHRRNETLFGADRMLCAELHVDGVCRSRVFSCVDALNRDGALFTATAVEHTVALVAVDCEDGPGSYPNVDISGFEVKEPLYLRSIFGDGRLDGWEIGPEPGGHGFDDGSLVLQGNGRREETALGRRIEGLEPGSSYVIEMRIRGAQALSGQVAAELVLAVDGVSYINDDHIIQPGDAVRTLTRSFTATTSSVYCALESFQPARIDLLVQDITVREELPVCG